MTTTAIEPYVTTRDVADFIGKPRGWIDNNAGRLGLPRHKIGRHYRYRLSEVAEWITRQGSPE